MVSVVHVIKGRFPSVKVLDGREVETITAFLFHRGGHDDPPQLAANAGMSFQGVIVLGMGFTFDDTASLGVATPLAEMRRLINSNPRNADRIFPYIGYSEVANDPTQAPHRYVINFGERDEEECRQTWPELLAIIEEKVKPDRLTKDARKYPRMVHEWWKFWNPRPELEAAITELNRVIVAGSQASTHYALTFLPKGMIYSSNLTVFAVDAYSGFAMLQSRIHEIWARFFMSTMKDDLAYTPTSCFEPFPFCERWQADPSLEHFGKAYCEFRAALMLKAGDGLTKIYNRFHDPHERDPAIQQLRTLHAEMDRAVLGAYRWDDIPTDCEFLLEYEIGEAEWGNKKKPFRYRWPDDVQDEVLARLIELNGKQAAAEELAGAATRKQRARAMAMSAAVPTQPKGLF